MESVRSARPPSGGARRPPSATRSRPGMLVGRSSLQLTTAPHHHQHSAMPSPNARRRRILHRTPWNGSSTRVALPLLRRIFGNHEEQEEEKGTSNLEKRMSVAIQSLVTAASEQQEEETASSTHEASILVEALDVRIDPSSCLVIPSPSLHPPDLPHPHDVSSSAATVMAALSRPPAAPHDGDSNASKQLLLFAPLVLLPSVEPDDGVAGPRSSAPASSHAPPTGGFDALSRLAVNASVYDAISRAGMAPGLLLSHIVQLTAALPLDVENGTHAASSRSSIRPGDSLVYTAATETRYHLPNPPLALAFEVPDSISVTDPSSASDDPSSKVTLRSELAASLGSLSHINTTSPPSAPALRDAEVFQLLFWQLIVLGLSSRRMQRFSQGKLARGSHRSLIFDPRAVLRIDVSDAASTLDGAPMVFKLDDACSAYLGDESLTAATRRSDGDRSKPAMCIAFDASAPLVLPSPSATVEIVDWASESKKQQQSGAMLFFGDAVNDEAAAEALGTIPCATRLGRRALRWASEFRAANAADALWRGTRELFEMFRSYGTNLRAAAFLSGRVRLYRLTANSVRSATSFGPPRLWDADVVQAAHRSLAVNAASAFTSATPSPIKLAQTPNKNDASRLEPADDLRDTFTRQFDDYVAGGSAEAFSSIFRVPGIDSLLHLSDETVIGSGGSGVVFRSTWHGMPVAVKCFVVPDGKDANAAAYFRDCVIDAAFFTLSNALDVAGVLQGCRCHMFAVCDEFTEPNTVRADWYKRCRRVVTAKKSKKKHKGHDRGGAGGNGEEEILSVSSIPLCFMVTDLVDGTLGRFLPPDHPDYDPSYDTIENSALSDVEAVLWIYWQLALRATMGWVIDDLLLQQQVRGDNIGVLKMSSFRGANIKFLSLSVPVEDQSAGESLSLTLPIKETDRMICLIDVGQGRQCAVQQRLFKERGVVGDPVVESCVVDDGMGRYYDDRGLYLDALEAKTAQGKEILDWARSAIRLPPVSTERSSPSGYRAAALGALRQFMIKAREVLGGQADGLEKIADAGVVLDFGLQKENLKKLANATPLFARDL